MKDTFVYQLEDSLYINLTNRCSNSCVFCVRNNHDGMADYKDCAAKAEELGPPEFLGIHSMPLPGTFSPTRYRHFSLTNNPLQNEQCHEEYSRSLSAKISPNSAAHDYEK